MSASRDGGARVRENARAIEHAPVLVRALPAEDEIVGHRVVEHEPAAMAIFRDVREPARLALAQRESGDVGARDADLAALRSAEPDDRLDERALAIPFHARDAEDLAGLHRERHVVHRARAPLAGDDEIAHLERGHRGGRRCIRARVLRGRVSREHHIAPDHCARDRRGARARRGEARDGPPRAHHGDRVRDLRHLVQLVRDENDRAAIVPQRAQHAPQLLHLGRGEHRRRLVENENARAAHERLQDLDALLLADAELAHVLAHVHAEAAALRGSLDFALRTCACRSRARAWARGRG